MKYPSITHSTLALAMSVAWLVPENALAERIVLMYTNDTHSQIDPAQDGMGGVARRKVLIDSIRQENPYSLLLDSGDAVQGTVYFNLYGGEIEAKLLNALGYDYVTLGNHEFDNGMEALAQYVISINAPFISTNYGLEGSSLDGLVSRYKIIDIAGKRIGLIALNVEPAGMIDPAKSIGVEYQNVYKAANATAWHLKHNEGVDYVVALSHIGYDYDGLPDDVDVATKGNDIDLIIGGHSHTVVPPGTDESIKINSDGKPVVITQTGSTGKYLGVVTIDTDDNTIKSQLIPVDSRLDNRLDNEIVELIKPYRHGVDSLKNIVIGKTKINQPVRGSEEVINFVSAFEADKGRRLINGRKIDLAMANRGGVRSGMPAGKVTRGQIMEMLPFDNRVVVLEISGSDLLEALEINAASHRVSYDRMVTVEMDGDKLLKALIDGKQVDPNATYTIATIDYIAKGGDYMKPLTRGKVIAKSDQIMNADVMEYIERLPRKTIKSDPTNYMTILKK